nr:nuclear transport factor 2 family protein [Sphingomonas tagetis]
MVAVIHGHDRGLEARDSELMRRLLPESFLQVTPAGTPKGREEWFDWFENTTRYDSMRREIVEFRKLDGVIAVLSRCSPIMRVRDGEPSEHRAMMLELWACDRGQWTKAYEQYTRPPLPAA